jgi:hypothetical protein
MGTKTTRCGSEINPQQRRDYARSVVCFSGVLVSNRANCVLQSWYDKSVLGPVGGDLTDKDSFEGQDVKSKWSDPNFTGMLHLFAKRS